MRAKMGLFALGSVGFGGAATAFQLMNREDKILEKMKSLPKHKIETAEEGQKTAVVIGAGVAGVSSAYTLIKRGYSVTVLDMSSPGSECSAVAAGGMQRSNVVLSRDMWWDVIKSWKPFGKSEGDKFKFFHIDWLKTLTDPHFLRWICLFSFNSFVMPDSLIELQKQQFNFTLFASDRMKSVLEKENIDCGINPSGAVFIRYDTSTKKSFSAESFKRIGKKELLQLEPSIGHWPQEAVCADLETESWSGNVEKFTKALAGICEDKLGVNFLCGMKVLGFQTQENGSGDRRVITLLTSQGEVEIGEGVELVVAAGSWTPRLLAQLGLFCPTYPMKGYSVAMDLPPLGSQKRPEPASLPGRMLIDNKTFITRLGDQIRLTSIGEFSGWSTEPNLKVNTRFRAEVRSHLAPALHPLFDQTPTRCGLRPYSADGILMAGRVEGTSNLSVNVGPGATGWKNAIGAAEVLADNLNGGMVHGGGESEVRRENLNRGMVHVGGEAEEKSHRFCTGLFSPGRRIRPAIITTNLARIVWSN